MKEATLDLFHPHRHDDTVQRRRSSVFSSSDASGPRPNFFLDDFKEMLRGKSVKKTTESRSSSTSS